MNLNDIEKALSNLKTEVKDLHPHLKALFNKMKVGNIVSVKYTHGIYEKGADFVLTEKDPTLDAINYIGVIVKNGNVNTPAIKNIQHQISECQKIDRKVENGKQKISINKIWVVVNGKIAQNAQDQILSDKTLGLQFIDRQGIASLMKQYDYSISANIPATISSCLSNEIDKVERLKKQSFGNVVSNENYQIERRLRPIDLQYHINLTQNTRKNKNKTITVKEAVKNNSIVYIHGSPGSGKSHILFELVCHYADADQYAKNKTISIYISAIDIVKNHNNSLSEFVEHYEQKNNICKEDNIYYNFFIDNAELCANTSSERLEVMKKWVSEVYPSRAQKIIYVSRDFIRKTELDKGAVYKIQELSIKEVVGIIKENLKELSSVDRIIRDLTRSEMFRSLPRHTIAVAILVKLMQEIDSAELPSTLPELYAKYTEFALGRWDKNISEGIKQRKFEAKKAILANIGQHMVQCELNQLHLDEAKGFFKKYLDSRNLNLNADELINELIIGSDIILVDDNLFKFRHRTICEFFNAQLFTEEIINKHQENIFSPKMINSLYFYVGKEKDCGKLIEKISAITPTSDGLVILKLVNISNILLAGYATEYNYIESAIEKTFIDIADYVEDIIHGNKPESYFSNLSTMHLLCLIRTIVACEYSYPFFIPAIESALIKIQDNKDISTDTKANALFLTHIAYANLGGEDIFTDMINKKEIDIPIHIKLAIDHETHFMKKVSKDVKKYKRALEKGLRKKQDIHYLYNKKIIDIPKIENKDN